MSPSAKTSPRFLSTPPGKRKLIISPAKAAYFSKMCLPPKQRGGEETMKIPVGFVIVSVNRFRCSKSDKPPKSSFCFCFRVYCENILRL